MSKRKDEHKDDYLNRILTDLVADQVLLALVEGFNEDEVREAMRLAMFHGKHEYEDKQDRRKGWKKKALGRAT